MELWLREMECEFFLLKIEKIWRPHVDVVEVDIENSMEKNV